MPYCSECGAELDAGVKFCQECGAKVKGRGKRPSEAPSVQETMEDCGDGIFFEAPLEATPKQEPEAPQKQAPQKKLAMPKVTFPKVTRKMMLVVGIILIVSALGVFYMFSGGSQGGVPVYPGATEYTYQGQTVEQLLSTVGVNLPTDWSAKMYQTTAFTGTVMNWYRNNMPGWTIEYDNVINLSSDFVMGILGFTKGSDGAFSISMDVPVDSGENHYFIIMTGPTKDMQNLISGNF